MQSAHSEGNSPLAKIALNKSRRHLDRLLVGLFSYSTNLNTSAGIWSIPTALLFLSDYRTLLISDQLIGRRSVVFANLGSSLPRIGLSLVCALQRSAKWLLQILIASAGSVITLPVSRLYTDPLHAPQKPSFNEF